MIWLPSLEIHCTSTMYIYVHVSSIASLSNMLLTGIPVGLSHVIRDNLHEGCGNHHNM